ncbi:glycosyltransferase family protein [Anaeromyxobacter paludicola]|uniref:Glycosyl transferase family 2 n=1 Tax=Anaeromyxobacter paludicola TaxID=2918171 RepID=A0ABN6N9A0_9BACT|nr:hypothetical protein [Anaeromyxobacter paludicola]BDG09651.1 hypothetical protein AMPC_27640 [Anaeromyxobacter paludicola]
MSGAPPAPRYRSFTVVLPVHEEAARLERVLRYYQRFAPVVVVDDESTDGSAELARGCGARVIRLRNAGTTQTPEWFRQVAGLLETEHFAVPSCSELLPARLLARYDEVARTGGADVVSTVRRVYTSGRLLTLWGDAPRVERFFDRRGLDYDAIEIHAPFRPRDPARLLALPPEPGYVITHLRDVDAVSLTRKHVAYAAVEARHRAERGRPLQLGGLLKLSAIELIQLARQGPRGWSGLALRETWARLVMHALVAWAGWELRTGAGLEDSRRRNADLWDELTREPGDGPDHGAAR